MDFASKCCAKAHLTIDLHKYLSAYNLLVSAKEDIPRRVLVTFTRFESIHTSILSP